MLLTSLQLIVFIHSFIFLFFFFLRILRIFCFRFRNDKVKERKTFLLPIFMTFSENEWFSLTASFTRAIITITKTQMLAHSRCITRSLIQTQSMAPFIDWWTTRSIRATHLTVTRSFSPNLAHTRSIILKSALAHLLPWCKLLIHSF